MPLFDAYGVPVPESKPSTNAPPKSTTSLSNTKTPRTLRSRLISWHNAPRPTWFRFLEAIAILGFLVTVFFSVLQLRQEISVDPSVSYDDTDPFSQRFLITNNGPLSIEDVHYACAITNIQTDGSAFDNMIATAPMKMLPTAFHIDNFAWKKKISTDCDFIARFGPHLSAVQIEIEIFYRRFGTLCHGPGWKFSGKRDIAGKFVWDYGSQAKGIFDEHGAQVVSIVPFNSPCIKFDPTLIYEDTKKLAKMMHEYQHKVVISTMLPCTTEKEHQPVTPSR